MPIEIKELHIRVAVNTGNTEPPASAARISAAASGGSSLDEEGENALVAECVEQVLHILENKKER